MRKLSPFLLYSVTFLALIMTVTGFLTPVSVIARIFQILFVPVTFLLVVTSINHIFNKAPFFNRGKGAKRFLVYYCFVISSVVVMVGFLSATNLPQFLSSFIFTTLTIYFLILVWPKHGYQADYSIHDIKPAKIHYKKEAEIPDDLMINPKTVDFDRRDFLKLVGTAGITAFVLNLFSNKGFNFFGNAEPALSTAALTDASGNRINPAQQKVTDNYSITEIDDSAATAYFGFINETGSWYVMKQDPEGAFRYCKGETDFPASWANREGLKYDYFSNVF